MAKRKFSESNPVDNPANDPLKDYETKDHLDTIIRSHAILMDPEKMKKVHKLAGRHAKAISSIKDLKDTLQKKYGPKADSASKTAANNDDDGDEGA